jgi:hypothetical protein
MRKRSQIGFEHKNLINSDLPSFSPKMNYKNEAKSDRKGRSQNEKKRLAGTLAPPNFGSAGASPYHRPASFVPLRLLVPP